MNLLLMLIACGSENLILDPDAECETSDIANGAITYELSCPDIPACPTVNLTCPELIVPACPAIEVTCPEPIVTVTAPTVTVEPAEVNVTVDGPDMSGIEAAIDDLAINMSNAVSGNYDLILDTGWVSSVPVQIFHNNTTGTAFITSVISNCECLIEEANGNTVDLFTNTGQQINFGLDPGDSVWCQVHSSGSSMRYIISGHWY